MGGVLLAEGGGNGPDLYPHIVNRSLERDFGLMAYAEILKIKAYAAVVNEHLASDAPLSAMSTVVDNPAAWVAFVVGYREAGGKREWEAHFVNDVLPCEGGVWAGYYGPPISSFISRAQFAPRSWATVNRMLGPLNPDSPFDVGRAVAWWANNISHPGDTSGWPTCWWRGVVP